jgi:hypothetical protein
LNSQQQKCQAHPQPCFPSLYTKKKEKKKEKKTRKKTRKKTSKKTRKRTRKEAQKSQSTLMLQTKSGKNAVQSKVKT